MKTKKRLNMRNNNNNNNNNKTQKVTEVSLEKLKQMKRKYKVSTTGSKKEIAQGLYRVSGFVMDNKDLVLIMPLLQKEDREIIEKKINMRISNPITDYKGMWKPKSKPLNKMTRSELMHNLKSFRDAWEKNTGRNQDLSNDRISNETTRGLRILLKWYYSDESKLIAEDYLR